eukprot:131610-Prymnesium_polylepis.1
MGGRLNAEGHVPFFSFIHLAEIVCRRVAPALSNMLRALLACALLACALGKGVAPTLISQLKAQGDATVVSVACCGTSGGAVVRKALGAPASAVSVVEAATPIVLASLGDAGEAAAVLSASDVLAVE